MIQVNEPFLPPIEEYFSLVKEIWEKKWITNNGPLLLKLENNIKNHLKVNNLSFVSNGTIALQIAIKALNLKGEIITTPFTYVATSSSIVWEGCSPVFVDIDHFSLNIDVKKIEEAITPKTSAIIATHVYGNPCDVISIQNIAEKYNLKVIYDAAHAFGVELNGESIFNYGDISTCSTHATKLFHTCEGGFLVSKNEFIFEKIKSMRNFGHNGPYKFSDVGINGKNSEFHAAMGIINLKYLKNVFERRKEISLRYDKNLKDFCINKPVWHKDSLPNFSYYPIIFDSEEDLLRSLNNLNLNNVYGRRYFYPLLSESLPYVSNSIDLPEAKKISKRILCLPLYYSLKNEEVDFICKLLLDC